jgi:hypothetical protein
MIDLFKKIEGEIFDNPFGDVKCIKSIEGQIQEEDYINLNGFVGFLQNLSKVEDTSSLLIPTNFGLKNTYNVPMITLEIDY